MASSWEGDYGSMMRGADKLSYPPGKIASDSSMKERTPSIRRAVCVFFGFIAGLLNVVRLGRRRRDSRKEVELLRGNQFRRHGAVVELLNSSMVCKWPIVTMAWASLNIKGSVVA